MTYAEAALLQPGDHVVIDTAENMRKHGYCVMADMLRSVGEEVVIDRYLDNNEISDDGEVLATHRIFYVHDLQGRPKPYFYSEGTIARSVDSAPPATASELMDFLFSGVGL